MHSIKHWTVKYIKNRIWEKRYRLQNPNLPWLTPAANSFLEHFLKKTDIGFEFGSGRSTLWFAKRIAKLISVEHDRKWFEVISREIQKQSLKNIEYYQFDLEEMSTDSIPAYVDVINSQGDNTLDFVLVDGKFRDHCAIASIKKMKRSGILIIDNADVYLPSDCDTPNSRSSYAGTNISEWDLFDDLTRDWRRYWTCNGVSATAIFFKP